MVKGVTGRPRGWGFKSLQGKVYVFMTTPRPTCHPWSQIASLTSSLIAIYTTFVVDRTTIDYKVDFQFIGALAKVNT